MNGVAPTGHVFLTMLPTTRPTPVNRLLTGNTIPVVIKRPRLPDPHPSRFPLQRDTDWSSSRGQHWSECAQLGFYPTVFSSYGRRITSRQLSPEPSQLAAAAHSAGRSSEVRGYSQNRSTTVGSSTWMSMSATRSSLVRITSHWWESSCLPSRRPRFRTCATVKSPRTSHPSVSVENVIRVSRRGPHLVKDSRATPNAAVDRAVPDCIVGRKPRQLCQVRPNARLEPPLADRFHGSRIPVSRQSKPQASAALPADRRLGGQGWRCRSRESSRAHRRAGRRTRDGNQARKPARVGRCRRARHSSEIGPSAPDS